MFERALAAIDDGSLNARVEFVFMHRERGEGEGSDAFMDLAAQRSIPVESLSSARFREERGGRFSDHREEFDARVLEMLDPYKPDICVLAGYLLILSPLLTNAFPCVNLHPALPDGPVGLWQKVIWGLIETKAEESGVMTFLVTDELDKGPPISYARFSLRGERLDTLWRQADGQPVPALQATQGEQHPLFAAIRAEGVRREPLLLLETLKSIANGEVVIRGGSVLDGTGAPITPYDLTQQVDAALVKDIEG
ncbi:MAG: formyltransferase family protein [Dehalococcoidia bacterium]